MCQKSHRIWHQSCNRGRSEMGRNMCKFHVVPVKANKTQSLHAITDMNIHQLVSEIVAIHTGYLNRCHL